MKGYLWNLLIGLDQLANVLLAGSPDETLSSRAWRTEQAGKVFGEVFRPLIDFLALVITLGYDRDHCYDSYVSEITRKHLHPAMQKPT